MSLRDQRVLITGANGGLGLQTSIQVLAEGAQLVLGCRSGAKADEARAAALRGSNVPADRAQAAGGFDMFDPDRIAAAVDALGPEPFDVVFLQAGGWVFADVVQTHEWGGHAVEKSVFLNVLGAHATLAALGRTGRLAPGCRVVIIGGEGARGIPGGIAKPAFDGVDDFRRYLAGDWEGRDPYVPVNALGVAKLCAALWAQRLARSTQDLEVVWFTPGFIAGTGGTRGMPAWQEWIVQNLVFPLLVLFGKAQWPAAAAAKCVDCLAGRVGKHGDLLGAPEGTALGPLTDQTPMQAHFADVAMQDTMWSLAEQVVGPLELSGSQVGSEDSPIAPSLST